MAIIPRSCFNSDRESFKNTASTNDFNLLENVVLNGAAATRTVELQLGKAKSLLVGWSFVYHAATAILLTVSVSMDGGTSYFQLQSRDIEDGLGTDTNFSDSRSTGAASCSGALQYSVAGATHAKIVIAGTGADGTDTVCLQAAIANY